MLFSVTERRRAMKFRLEVPEDRRGELTAFLAQRGIELSDDAEYVISNSSRSAAFLSARSENGESLRLSVDEIICIEAFGKDIEVHTAQGTYYAFLRMYQLEEALDPKEFLRISKSVMISRKNVKKIRPSLSMKFILTMSDGRLVDVTRSFYGEFRRFFGI